MKKLFLIFSLILVFCNVTFSLDIYYTVPINASVKASWSNTYCFVTLYKPINDDIVYYINFLTDSSMKSNQYNKYLVIIDSLINMINNQYQKKIILKDIIVTPAELTFNYENGDEIYWRYSKIEDPIFKKTKE